MTYAIKVQEIVFHVQKHGSREKAINSDDITISLIFYSTLANLSVLSLMTVYCVINYQTD